MRNKKIMIFSVLLAMQASAFAQNPIIQTQLTDDPAPMVNGDRLYIKGCKLFSFDWWKFEK